MTYETQLKLARSKAPRAFRQLWRNLCLGTALVLVGCGGGPTAPRPQVGDEPANDDFPGIGQVRFALLGNNCVVTASSMTVVVDAGETATFSINLASGNVALNANQAGGAACEVPLTASLSVSAGTAGEHDVLLDFSNGLFSKAIAANSPKIAVNLGGGATDGLSVRGSSGVDHYYLGKGSVVGTYLLNLNGGVGAGEDSLPDVSITGVESVLVSTGAGNDILDANGLYGTVAPYPGPLSLFGGANADVISGGSGNDILSGDAGDDTLTGGLGANVYACGNAADGTDSIVVAGTAIDSVDYSQRFNSVTVNLDNTPSSGELGENDTIPDTVSVVIGGNGNDALSALGSTRKHALKGGPGNDTLTGGGGNDTLLGGDGVLQVDGDDTFIGNKATADYSSRSQALTITMNSAGNGGADANDGDPTLTRPVQAATAAAAGATIMASTNTVTGLLNMNAGSVGRRLIIAGSSAGKDNGSYRIASVPNATSVVLNASDTAANSNWADDLSAAWTFAENAAAEKDEVRCLNVIGSATMSNTITGDANANRITGGAAADTLAGGAGADTLIGLAQSDSLYGGPGDDTLIGGPGNDALYGGDDNDVLEADSETDYFQCDGRNDAQTLGSAPGNADITIDYTPGSPDFDSRAAPNDCEF